MHTMLRAVWLKSAIVIVLSAMPLSVIVARAQSFNGHNCEDLWDHVDAGGYVMYEETNRWFYSTCGREEEEADDDEVGSPAVQKQEAKRTVLTCPSLPPSVVVFGYVEGTQCQMVGAAGVGNAEVIERGFINAVDIWSYVNGGIEVCFRNAGSLVFLDAHYAPRMLMDLPSFQRDGMTCGAIDGAGTVVLVHIGAPTAPPPAPDEPTLPTFDSAPPISNCLVKLTETLFLRATPAGEIIGLVWLYSEVPVFETNGDWHKVEFEGEVGYISRRYVRVLHGGCG